MFDKIIAFLGHVSPLIGIITFFIGRWWGRKDAIAIARRNEWNKASEPVHVLALSHASELRSRLSKRIPISEQQIDSLLWHCDKKDADKIKSAWLNYKDIESRTGDEYWQDPSFNEWDEYVAAAEKLGFLTKKK